MREILSIKTEYYQNRLQKLHFSMQPATCAGYTDGSFLTATRIKSRRRENMLLRYKAGHIGGLPCLNKVK